MPKYRKKPVDVEMMQWDGHDLNALQSWADDLCERNENVRTLHAHFGAEGGGALRFHVASSQGEATIRAGDWVVAERNGDGYYPLMQAEQLETYEQEPIVDAES